MHGALPETIDPRLLAGSGRRLAGSLPLDRMPRLELPQHGVATVELAFGIDPQGLRVVTGRVVADVELLCQRCLGPFSHRVDCAVALAVVASTAEERRLPEQFEPLRVGEEPLRLAELVEDEILLALPLVARHPQADCNGALARQDRADVAPRDNPFSVLKQWTKTQDEREP